MAEAKTSRALMKPMKVWNDRKAAKTETKNGHKELTLNKDMVGVYVCMYIYTTCGVCTGNSRSSLIPYIYMLGTNETGWYAYIYITLPETNSS